MCQHAACAGVWCWPPAVCESPIYAAALFCRCACCHLLLLLLLLLFTVPFPSPHGFCFLCPGLHASYPTHHHVGGASQLVGAAHHQPGPPCHMQHAWARAPPMCHRYNAGGFVGSGLDQNSVGNYGLLSSNDGSSLIVAQSGDKTGVCATLHAGPQGLCHSLCGATPSWSEGYAGRELQRAWITSPGGPVLPAAHRGCGRAVCAAGVHTWA